MEIRHFQSYLYLNYHSVKIFQIWLPNF